MNVFLHCKSTIKPVGLEVKVILAAEILKITNKSINPCIIIIPFFKFGFTFDTLVQYSLRQRQVEIGKGGY